MAPLRRHRSTAAAGSAAHAARSAGAPSGATPATRSSPAASRRASAPPRPNPTSHTRPDAADLLVDQEAEVVQPAAGGEVPLRAAGPPQHADHHPEAGLVGQAVGQRRAGVRPVSAAAPRPRGNSWQSTSSGPVAEPGGAAVA